MSSFKILSGCSKTQARLGCLKTRAGSIDTPQFMPVGTYGAVKAMAPF
ncbi:tRNA guanosine(34) transglycosylase Tgt, partial [bacterium]|nr:tRNA guanosine(34) transglycosylase Tgt [bacterium]